MKGALWVYPDVLGGALSSHHLRRPGPCPGTQHCQHVGGTRVQSLGSHSQSGGPGGGWCPRGRGATGDAV